MEKTVSLRVPAKYMVPLYISTSLMNWSIFNIISGESEMLPFVSLIIINYSTVFNVLSLLKFCHSIILY